MRISCGSLLGLLSAAYVVLKVFVYINNNGVGIRRECEDDVAMEVLKAVRGYTVWSSITSVIVTIGIMIYYISRSDAHRSKAWCHDQEELERAAFLWEVTLPLLVAVAGTVVLALDVAGVAALVVPGVYSIVKGSTYTVAGVEKACARASRVLAVQNWQIASAVVFVGILVLGHYAGLYNHKRERDRREAGEAK